MPQQNRLGAGNGSKHLESPVVSNTQLCPQNFLVPGYCVPGYVDLQFATFNLAYVLQVEWSGSSTSSATGTLNSLLKYPGTRYRDCGARVPRVLQNLGPSRVPKKDSLGPASEQKCF
eukprot:1099078-Rhodomonas_salina.3